jgi:CheY-like chemotaxis protein
MPGMDGFAAAAQIRHLELISLRASPVPIIALTASLSEQDRQKGFEVGMNDFCTKPIKRVDLEELLIKVCHLEID